MSYKRESWMMKKDEKLKSVPPLHKEGNTLVKQGRFREAATCYQEAVVTLRAAQSRVRLGDGVIVGMWERKSHSWVGSLRKSRCRPGCWMAGN